eukprot:gene15331-biopygen8755
MIHPGAVMFFGGRSENRRKSVGIVCRGNGFPVFHRLVVAAEGTGVEDGSSVRKVDKYDTRLQTLEKRQYRDAARVEISQAEYESAVSKLSSNLDNAWSKDERVESLKIAIQLGKLLSNTNVAQFYPSMFVTVTDVLNHFGDLVFNRLFSKAEE